MRTGGGRTNASLFGFFPSFFQASLHGTQEVFRNYSKSILNINGLHGDMVEDLEFPRPILMSTFDAFVSTLRSLIFRVARKSYQLFEGELYTWRTVSKS